MNIKFKRTILVAVTALFCTVAFSSTLISSAGDSSTQAGDTPWSAPGSESMTQTPLLLAGSKGSMKKKGSTSKTYYYYCEIKRGSKGKIKIKSKKGSTLEKVNRKMEKCNNKAPKYECLINKCDTYPSYS